MARPSTNRALHGLLDAAQRNDGFQGGDYLPNPLWRPVPDKFSGITGGQQPERLVTVHPLGGCAMADDAMGGVVDRTGAVFSEESGTAVHPGLHVLDGAIVPCALGVNPFLTITALSLLAARAIKASLDVERPARGAVRKAVLPTAQPRAGRHPYTPAGPVVLRFQEHLQSAAAQEPPAWAAPLLEALLPPGRGEPGRARTWVAEVSVAIDAYRWLGNPTLPLQAELSLYVNHWPESPTVRPEVLRPANRVLHGKGQVTLLAADPPGGRSVTWARAWEALRTYLARRSARDLAGTLSGGVRPLEALSLFLRAGRNHADYRELQYRFDLGSDRLPTVVRASGRKRLAYRRDERNVWDALTRLDMTLSPPEGGPAWPLPLEVDLADMVKRRRLQVASAPNTPAALVAVAGFAALWLRALLRTQFWSFRGMDYARLQKVRVPAPPDLPGSPPGTPGAAVRPVVYPLTVDRGHAPGGRIDLKLVRYPGPAGAVPVLLIHGLAHGSGVFTTQTVAGGNLAGYLLGQGHDVWLLDHRLSNRLGYAAESHTMDMVARHDVAAAVQEVRRLAGAPQIDVFAHCVGAGAFSMAVLAGWVPAGSIRRAILHAVHPWVVPSVSNRLSASLAAIYKDFLAAGVSIDPVPPAGAGGAIDELIDRFGASLPWPDGDLDPHLQDRYDPLGGYGACNRMTVYYGREWEHANLDPATHRELAGLVGIAGLEVFRQLYFIIERERLTNRDGANVYLTRQQLQDHWTFPTLFAHGGRNKVFDPRSAVRSWQRMARVMEQANGVPPPVHLYVQSGYGHMDFLFGRQAHRDVYPTLASFLRAPEEFRSTVGGAPAQYLGANVVDGEDIGDYHYIAPRRPVCGPMVQIEGWDGQARQLVLWFEQAADSTSEPELPGLAIDGVAVTDASFARPPSQTGEAVSVNESVSRGPGFHWTLVVPDTDGRLAGMGTLVLEARTQGGSVQQPRSARAAADPDWGLGTKSRDWQLGLLRTLASAHQADAGGLLAELAAQAPAPTPASAVPTVRPPPDDQALAVLSFRHLAWWRRWMGQLGDVPVSLLAASCRWPGTPFEADAADRLAARMLDHVLDERRPVDALVLLGDQIYADATANVAETTEVAERGQERYRAAWQGEHTARLFRHVPTWLVLDDHEFSDNAEGAGSPDFGNGWEAALAYQWRWRRDRDAPAAGPGPSVRRGFWHRFAIGGVPAFAADTRTERSARTGAAWQEAALLHDDQLAAIQAWLLEHRERPKFLCCGSVLGLPERRVLQAPPLARHADDWTGYPSTWARLARFIAQQGIRNLVVLAGDYHLSAVAELEIVAPGTPGPARVVSVVASGWNASLPFANPAVFDHAWGERVQLPLGGEQVQTWSTAQCISRAQRQFTKLTLLRRGAGWELEIASHEEDGAVKSVTPVLL